MPHRQLPCAIARNALSTTFGAVLLLLMRGKVWQALPNRIKENHERTAGI